MRAAVLVAGFWALALASCRRPAARPGEASQRVRVVSIAGFDFVPSELSLGLGDSVAWVNLDDFRHTTTADSAAWSSPELARGQRFAFVARRAGRFPYHCAAHPQMRGVLVVLP